MVFDWLGNCEKVVREGRITSDAPSDAKRVKTQEYFLVRYMRHNLGWDRERAKGFWASLVGGTASSPLYPEPGDADAAFRWLWDACARKGPVPPLAEVPIYSGDVEYLNSLEAPLSVRRFWLWRLVWMRTVRRYGNADPQAGTDADGELWRLSGGKGPYWRARPLIDRWSRRCGVPFASAIRVAVPKSGALRGVPVDVAVVTAPWSGKGERVAVGKLVPGGVPDLLSERSFRCPECGRAFDRERYPSEPVGKVVCGACKERRKRELTKERVRKYREKKDTIAG